MNYPSSTHFLSTHFTASECSVVENDVAYDSPSRKAVVSATTTTTTDENEGAGRVLPLLCHELRTRNQTLQFLHLTEFRKQVHARSLPFWDQLDAVRPDEAEEFILVLLILIQRRDGLTNFQRVGNNKASDLAFTILVETLSKQTAAFPILLAALERLMKSVDCTVAELFRRLELPPATKTDPNLPPIEDLVNEPDPPPPVLRVVRRKSEAVEQTPPPPPPPEEPCEKFDPWLFSINCLPELDRGDLTEDQFLAIEKDFKVMDKDGQGSIDIREFMSSGGQIGGKLVGSVNLFRALDIDGSGSLSLFEVVQGFFQDVPRRYIERRIAGKPLPDDPKTFHIPRDKPEVLNPRLRIDLHISSLQRGRVHPNFTPEIVGLVKSWFNTLDVDRSGELSLREIQLAGGKLGLWTIDSALFKRLDKDRSGALGLAELLKQFFSNVPLNAIKKTVSEVVFASEAQWRRRLARKKEEDARWASMQRAALVERMDSLRQSSSGDAEELEAMMEYEDALIKWRADKARRFNERMERYRAIVQQKEKYKRIEMINNAEYMKEVPLVYAAERKPPEAVRFGLKITRKLFHLDRFLEREEMCSYALRLLHRLDLSGLCAAFWLKAPQSLHLYVDRPWAYPFKVYRDCAICDARPPAHRPWKCEQTVHVKTNIRLRSNIKYRFHFEGFNWGAASPINTVVVGYSGVQWESLNTMEEFGWPEGWDKETIVHFAPEGLTGCDQYYSKDGCATFKLRARSFVHVSFSVTAMLVTPEFGCGFPLTIQFEHQLENL